MKNGKNTQRSKNVEIIIKLAWSSLKSHLPWTYKNSSEGQKFHKLCVMEYAKIIENASKLY